MYKIMFSAGEASGDLQGAGVAAALKILYPDIKLFGVGGKEMQKAGVEIVYDIADLGVVGFLEIIKNLPRLLKLRKNLKMLMAKERPDVLVAIDYYGFNKHLAVAAKEMGIPVISYISPKIWASRAARVHEIARTFDHIASIHPWEAELYSKAGAKVTFIGHPLLDIVKPTMSKEEAYNYFKADPRQPLVLLMPGSRNAEIKNIMPVILAAAEEILQKLPDCQFYMQVASTISREILQNVLKTYTASVRLAEDCTYDLMHIASAGIVASGTATLETALMNVPTVLVYKLNPLTYFLAKFLVKIPYIGLPNIAAGKKIIPELIQAEASPHNIAQEILGLLSEQKIRRQMMENFKIMRQKLGGGGAVQKAAQVIIDAAVSGGKK